MKLDKKGRKSATLISTNDSISGTEFGSLILKDTYNDELFAVWTNIKAV